MTRQMTLPKEAKTDIMIWSSVFLADNTIAVGDSLGRVTFYDAKLGALLHCFKIHEADVLCLGLSPNEKQAWLFLRWIYDRFTTVILEQILTTKRFLRLELIHFSYRLI